MTFWQLVRCSFWHHRWMNLAVALAVATTTAVIVGALLVGDSVRGSLVQLTQERLGNVDLLLVNDRFFGPHVVESLSKVRGSNGAGVAAVEPMCLIANVTVEGRERGRVRGVLLVGRGEERLSDLGELVGNGPDDAGPFALDEDQIVINQALADDLQALVGDELIVRLPVTSEVPAESPLGRKDGQVRSRAGLKVAAILPMRGWGQFQLAASQQQPRTAFVRAEVLQQALNVDARINAVAVTSDSLNRSTDSELADALEEKLAVGADDAGFQVEVVQAVFGEANDSNFSDDDSGKDAGDSNTKTAWQYAQVTTDRMIFGDEAAETATNALRAVASESTEGTGTARLDRPQSVLTYLANSIAKVGEGDGGSIAPNSNTEIPYSTIAAIDPHPEIGPYFDEAGSPVAIEPGQIALNAWAAEDLGANIGDRIEIRYFAPETTHGTAVEESATFELAAILPLRKPVSPYRRRRDASFGEAPYWSNDPRLTPTVEGVTDQESIDSWDPPFPFDNSRVRDQDDEYWEYYRTTPKAFLTLADGQRLWGSRFGKLSAVRIPMRQTAGESPSELSVQSSIESALADQLRAHPKKFGFEFRTVKSDGLAAARGTTPFEWLFLGFSMFLLFSAVALTAILFRLATMLRQKELGALTAMGWPADQAGRALLYEASFVALLGGLLGIAAGIAYAAIMLAGLRTWWLAAVVTPFIHLHITLPAIVFGFLAGALASMFVVWWTLRKLQQAQPLTLLRGVAEDDGSQAYGAKQAAMWPIGLGIILAIVLAILGTRLSGESQAGCFFGGGAALLTSLLLFVRRRLRSSTSSSGRRSLIELAQSSVKRNPSRSLLTTALMASATFLIIAISAFRLAPTESGTGGFTWIGESDRPIFVDLNDPQQRSAEFGDKSAVLDGAAILPLRVQPGDDASCRNLYQATKPRLLGVPPEFGEYCEESTDSFAWAAAETPDCGWRALRPSEDDRVDKAGSNKSKAIPVILDKNTAIFSLHLSGRLGETFTLEYERPLTFRIVGLLTNSILQGSLLVDEQRLLDEFPNLEGNRMFLINVPPGHEAPVAATLEDRFNDEGLALRDATQELTELMAVQNTYLSTFQTLGILGLLLGAVGLAIVQVRNTIERRRELAAMQAIGFERGRLGWLVAAETTMLLVAGLTVGILAATATVMPHMIFGEAQIPVRTVATMLLSVFVIGLFSSWLGTMIIGRMPLLESLRRDA